MVSILSRPKLLCPFCTYSYVHRTLHSHINHNMFFVNSFEWHSAAVQCFECFNCHTDHVRVFTQATIPYIAKNKGYVKAEHISHAFWIFGPMVQLIIDLFCVCEKIFIGTYQHPPNTKLENRSVCTIQ